MTVSLVTGGAGFIGAHVSLELIKQGHEVIVLDDLSGGFIENLDSRVNFIRGSINDVELVEKIFKNNNIDYVYHFAAYAAEGLSHFIKRFNYNNNLIGSINLINESVKNQIKCFVFTSSIAVYGKAQLPMSEEMVPSPEDSYGIAKLAVEQELKCTNDMFGMNYLIFRPHNVYGEFQNIGDRYRNVVGIFMNQLLKGESLTIFGDGMQTRAFSYISDIAPVISKSVNNKEAYNNVFNIGADQDYTINQLAKEVMNAMEIKTAIRYLPARKEVIHAYSDHSKINKYFDAKCKNTTLEFGLKNMANWVKKVGSRASISFNNIEIYKNLPEIWLEK
jgi:UDP-glucose 4-epimerase